VLVAKLRVQKIGTAKIHTSAECSQ